MKKNLHNPVHYAGYTGLAAALVLFLAAAASSKPNIIIIYTDDHGYTDIGIHSIDSNVQTPAIDALINSGALMTSGYCTAPQCRPSRAGLMTGRYQNEFGFRSNENQYAPLEQTLISNRLQALGYRTGFVGKWHLEPLPPGHEREIQYPGNREDYFPDSRGFDEYWWGPMNSALANFNLAGETVPEQRIADNRNRVIVQGKAAEAFIERNKDSTFFLYLALFGPHVPRISRTDPYYLNFPEVDYPNYNAELDDIRRLGLALIKAIDDAVDGVMQKLREHGLEENTLIFFSSDNGAQPKFWNEIGGAETIRIWDGSENLPLRGEKGSLWEGGIRVPMFAYWKGTIPGGQIIDEAVITLDFIATSIIAGGGTPTPEMDGVDILPRLTGAAPSIERQEPLFWDWGQEIAVRKGDWKLHRNGNGDHLFHLAGDPMELNDRKEQHPEKYDELKADLLAWRNSLPPEGRSPLNPVADDFYVKGAPEGTAVDPRFETPYTDATASAYPAPITSGGPVSLQPERKALPATAFTVSRQGVVYIPPGGSLTRASVYDLEGNLVHDVPVTDKLTELDLNEIIGQNGVYIAQLHTTTSKENHKIILTR